MNSAIVPLSYTFEMRAEHVSQLETTLASDMWARNEAWYQRARARQPHPAVFNVVGIAALGLGAMPNPPWWWLRPLAICSGLILVFAGPLNAAARRWTRKRVAAHSRKLIAARKASAPLEIAYELRGTVLHVSANKGPAPKPLELTRVRAVVQREQHLLIFGWLGITLIRIVWFGIPEEGVALVKAFSAAGAGVESRATPQVTAASAGSTTAA